MTICFVATAQQLPAVCMRPWLFALDKSAGWELSCVGPNFIVLSNSDVKVDEGLVGCCKCCRGVVNGQVAEQWMASSNKIREEPWGQHVHIGTVCGPRQAMQCVNICKRETEYPCWYDVTPNLSCYHGEKYADRQVFLVCYVQYRH